MDLAAICEVLAGTQLSDGAARKAAEQRLDEAASGSPNQLVCALVAVLAAGGNVGAELRQEATVILRQLIVGNASRDPVWHELEEATQKTFMAQILSSLEQDPSGPVKRSAGQAAAAAANALAEDFDELTVRWPELLPVLSRLVAGGGDAAGRVVALHALKEMVPSYGEGMMGKGPQVIAMLGTTLSDTAPEVRAASAELVLELVECLEPEDAAPLAQVMPGVLTALQGFAKASQEEPLKDTLEALVSAIDEEPEFFKDNGLKDLWQTLMELAASGSQCFADGDVRHTAMEAAMSLAIGLSEDFCKPEGQPQLERLLALNVEWMMEVEESVDDWTTQGQEEDDDECDDDVVNIAEANLDRIAEKLDEDVFMPILFKLIRATWQSPTAGWRGTRAAVMAILQVVEHVDETSWVDQCVELISRNLAHAHPRVRYAAFSAVAQIADDHSPYVQETHHELLLPAVVTGIKDVNVRVATKAMDAFSSLGDELDCDDLEPYLGEVVAALLPRLQPGLPHALQESCLSSVATAAEVMEELFMPHYASVMPSLKQVIIGASGEKDRTVRGRAFECVSLVGSMVGKEAFAQDAAEVMQLMMSMIQAGFAADDPQRESVRDAAGKIAETLGRDFKPYVPALLPVIFDVLKHRPVEIDRADMPDEDGDDDDDEQPDMSLTMIDGKVMGLKTSILEEMKESLDLVNTLIEALEEDFCEFMPTACQSLLPLLELQLSEDLRERAFKTWELLADCARRSVDAGRLDRSVLQELVAKFLETIVGAMAGSSQGEIEESALGPLHARAVGVAGVIRKAGAGVLTKEGVKNIAGVVVQIMSRLQCAKDEPAEPPNRRRKSVAMLEDDEEEDENDEGDLVTKQSVRFALADVASALMVANPDDFCEQALPTYMQLAQSFLQPEAGESNHSLAFYITEKVIDSLGEKSVPYWNGFMTQALHGMLDKSAMVRQHAAGTIGCGARHAVFAVMAVAAASQIHRLLQKQGERHRRRRAMKADAKQMAFAVDAAIGALGDICEHHEQTLGEHAGAAWSMWLSNLPLRYDEEGGRRAHARLLALVARRHPALTSPQQLPQVVTILADVYKTKLSSTALDKDIAAAMVAIGEEPLQQLCGGIQEKHKKKVEQILQSAKAGA